MTIDKNYLVETANEFLDNRYDFDRYDTINEEFGDAENDFDRDRREDDLDEEEEINTSEAEPDADMDDVIDETEATPEETEKNKVSMRDIVKNLGELGKLITKVQTKIDKMNLAKFDIEDQLEMLGALKGVNTASKSMESDLSNFLEMNSK